MMVDKWVRASPRLQLLWSVHAVVCIYQKTVQCGHNIIYIWNTGYFLHLQTTSSSLSTNASVSRLFWFHFGLNPEPFVCKAGMLAATPCKYLVQQYGIAPDRFPEVDKLKQTKKLHLQMNNMVQGLAWQSSLWLMQLMGKPPGRVHSSTRRTGTTSCHFSITTLFCCTASAQSRLQHRHILTGWPPIKIIIRLCFTVSDCFSQMKVQRKAYCMQSCESILTTSIRF